MIGIPTTDLVVVGEVAATDGEAHYKLAPFKVPIIIFAKDIIEALLRGLSHEVTWTDVDYVSSKVEPAHEGGGKDTLMALQDTPKEGKWSREDEILDDQWIEKSRKTSRERGLKAATSHLGIN
ncbi:hypothetical protein ACFXTH_041847 [Malus domestica]